LGTLPSCPPRERHFQVALPVGKCFQTMAAESNTSANKDNLKVEKLSLLVLTLCIAVLVYLLVARPF
jgi:hypothetical protein